MTNTTYPVADSGELIGILYETFGGDAAYGETAGKLLAFIDNRLGPDVCLLCSLLALKVASLTKARTVGQRLKVRSLPGFEARFGVSFKLEIDRGEIYDLLDYFDVPRNWRINW